jgi:hypothetical protein
LHLVDGDGVAELRLGPEQLPPDVEADHADAPPIAHVIVGDEAALVHVEPVQRQRLGRRAHQRHALLLLVVLRLGAPARLLAGDVGAGKNRRIVEDLGVEAAELLARLLDLLGRRFVGIDLHDVGVGGALVGVEQRLLPAREQRRQKHDRAGADHDPGERQRGAPAIGIEGVAHRAQLIDEAHLMPLGSP